MDTPPVGLRLAELVASLSLATDLGLGQPEEHVLRQTVIATRLAKAAGFSGAEQAAAFYVSLLAWVGCVADSHEMAHWFGDDRVIRADSYRVDKAGLPMMGFLLGHIGPGLSPMRRMALTGAFLTSGFRDAMHSFVTHCQTTADIADRLRLQDEVCAALPQAFERWDGKGVPDGIAGARITRVMRVVQIADDAEVYCRFAGPAAAVEMLRSRSGTEFDPELVALCEQRPEVLDDVDAVDAWSAVIDGCAALDRWVPDAELTEVLEIFADYADLKSPWFLGHTRATAALAGAAALRCGMAGEEAAEVTRAALVSRLGVTGVSTGIWNKTTALSPAEFERVRMVPYLTERVLSRCARLRRLGTVAGLCHERMDGSGYPRGVSGAAIPPSARLIAAADTFQALGEDRPHRAAMALDQRCAILRDEVAAGRLDSDAVRGVLEAAGQRAPRRVQQVAGLTAREIEVLQLLVRGRSNKQIAAQLSITPRTAGTHIEHIYTKIGVTTRGAAAMFAMRHGLVGAD
ncbi:LuxR family transcriptional regulator [Nocardia sp. BSTN01]|uniref:HD domain-containing phosphohydrolase n=1 Tax=Nocardia sp. BSTN01 TaxID=2783665 RepID=UPI00188E9CA5|nr:HD domain-containing phosphohydrolase [Nocardia sp. BSTN01]MBF5000781.1 LuxR family transcriptional regulator [Nocardia sp. BSTN01]